MISIKRPTTQVGQGYVWVFFQVNLPFATMQQLCLTESVMIATCSLMCATFYAGGDIWAGGELTWSGLSFILLLLLISTIILNNRTTGK